MFDEPYLGAILCEEHWHASGNPDCLVEFLGERGSLRRWQLFACSCCHRILPLIEDDRSLAALSLAERQAEGLASHTEINEALENARAAALEIWSPGNVVGNSAALAATYALTSPRRAHFHSARATGSGQTRERLAQCRLLRELFGNPFRPFAFEERWRTPLVMGIGAYIYERETFEELTVLGDALEDAGCDEATLLEHCRTRDPHVRGCWALDAILDRK